MLILLIGNGELAAAYACDEVMSTSSHYIHSPSDVSLLMIQKSSE